MIITTELEELLRRLDTLAAIGAEPGGGRYRPLYSGEESKAMVEVEGWMRESGLSVRYDAVGNLIGRLEGENPNAPVIATGSHIDSVKNGGHLDGTLGALSALTAVSALAGRRGRPRVPVEAVVFRGEEGSRFPVAFLGSLAWVDRLRPVLTVQDEAGVALAEAMRRAGYDPERVEEARRTDLGMFIELHIEQGGVLESKGIPAGVVSGIVGVRWVKVRLRGKANHAGTTPMNLRHDAMLAAARMIDAGSRMVTEAGPPAVLTCGKINVKPGGSNIVAGECELTLDMRDLDSDRFDSLYRQVKETFHEIAAAHKVAIEWECCFERPSVPCDATIQAALGASARDLGIPAFEIASGAGHDAQVVAELCPVGMLFVPSIGGQSHCPEEETRTEDILAGVSILTQTLERLAY